MGLPSSVSTTGSSLFIADSPRSLTQCLSRIADFNGLHKV